MSKQNIEDIFPLSSIQQGILFHSLNSSQSGIYVSQFCYKIDNSLNLSILKQAWQHVINRHSILRTAFYWKQRSEPFQVVYRKVQLPWEEKDWCHLCSNQQQQFLEDFLQQDYQKGFDFSKPPLMRITAIRIAKQQYQFVWTQHHLITDGWSTGLVIKEVLEAYKRLFNNQGLSFQKSRPYRDYIAWLKQQNLSEAKAFWKQKLSGFSNPTPFKLDKQIEWDTTTSDNQKRLVKQQTVPLSESTTTNIQSLAKQHQLTLNTWLQGVFALLLSRYSGEKDIVFGATYSGRSADLIGIESMVGPFINTLPVRVQINSEEQFIPWLKVLQAQQTEALKYEHMPLVNIQSWSDVPNGKPLFESILVVENYPVDSSIAEHGDSLGVSDVQISESTNYPLTMIIGVGSQLSLRMSYDYRRFDEVMISQMLKHFQHLLEETVAEPEQYLSDFSLLSELERHQLLVDWNDTETDFPQFQCIHQLFEAQVERSPDAIAVVCQNQQLSYRELHQRANQLAHYLHHLGVGPEELVGLHMERSLEMVIILLGILKASGAYLPLDPNEPQQRISLILRDVDPCLVLTQQHLLSQLPEEHHQLLVIEQDWAMISQQPSNSLQVPLELDNLVYTIYTSGSTGQPKGVQIPHRALSNFLSAMEHKLQVSQEDTCIALTPLCFDIAALELFLPLTVGGQTVVIDRELARDGSQLSRELARTQASVIQATPASWQLLLQGGWQGHCSLKLLCGGEALSPNLAEKLLARASQLWNVYGPTETTIWSTAQQIHHPDELSIGTPLLNTEAYVLDAECQPVPIGVPGELYLGGTGLSRGYRNRWELTAEKFVPHPYTDQPGRRLYRTGDLVRYQRDGSLQYLGRMDNQVKLRGFRIELEELEHSLTEHPAVAQAVVSKQLDDANHEQLVGYVVPERASLEHQTDHLAQWESLWDQTYQESMANNSLLANQLVPQLRRYLQNRLPYYMVPASLMLLNELPLTANGKVDRQALPKLDVDTQSLETNYVAPRTREEKLLADIWLEVLNVDQVGIHDNFFELGGDSILSIQIVSKANKAGLELTPKQLFQHHTIAELAPVLDPVQTSETQQGMVTGTVPLTPIQHWFFEQNLPEPHHWNQAVLLETKESLDPARLAQVVEKLIQYHDALRLSFFQKYGAWQQYNADFDGIVPLTHFDLSLLPEAEQRPAIEQAVASLQGSLNLTQGPLLRVAQFHLGANQPNCLFMAIHHLAIDGVSWRILLEDLETLYRQLQNHETLQLLEKTTSFQQWSQSLHEYAQSKDIQQELDYWLTTLSGVENNSLPVDYAGEENTEASAETISVTLTQQETQSLLREVPAKYGTYINEVLLTAFVQTFAQQLEMPNLLINLEGYGREPIREGMDLSRTVGWFTSLFPVYLDVKGISHPADAIKTVKEQLRQIPNNGMGYGVLRYLGNDQVVEQLQALPQPEISFNYLGQFDQPLAESSLFQPAYESKGLDRSLQDQRPHVLDVSGLIVGQKLQLNWTYSQAIHKQTTIENLAQGFLEALRSLLAHCQSLDAVVYTPSDFPLAKLNQKQLDTLSSQFPQLEDIYPLSPMQQGLLFHTFTESNSGTYCSQFACTLEGNLDISSLKQSWQFVLSRHSILRTAFIWENLEQPLQIVCKTVDLPWSQYDWRTFATEEQQKQIESLLKDDRRQGFSLHQAPLMRLTLIKLSNNTYKLIWSSHHILLDGWSTSIVLNEVFHAYYSISNNQNPSLPSTRSYRDYITWLQQQRLSQAKCFWQETLSGFKVPNSIDLGITEKNKNQEAYNIQTIQLSATTTAKLRSILKTNQLTLNTAIQGAWALLLSYYNGQEDIVFGTTSSGRPSDLIGIESMVGLFINTLPLRVQVENEQYLLPWLKKLQDQQIEAREYEYTPLAKIHQWSDIPRGNSLFNSLVVFENYPIDSSVKQIGNTVEIKDTYSFIKNNYPITLRAIPKEALELHIMYDCSWFEKSAISDVLETVKIILNQFTEASQDTIQALRDFISQTKQDKQSKKEQQINHLSLQKFKTARRKKIGQ